jgi:CubicO group peptidase (beta-lactamase class C family)
LRTQDRARIAALYDRHEDGSLSRVPDEKALEFNGRDWPMKPGSYGLVSTLDDYMRFARMLQNGGELDGARILKPETVRLMATDAMPAEVTDTSKPCINYGISLGYSVYLEFRLLHANSHRRHSQPAVLEFIVSHE